MGKLTFETGNDRCHFHCKSLEKWAFPAYLYYQLEWHHNWDVVENEKGICLEDKLSDKSLFFVGKRGQIH